VLIINILNVCSLDLIKIYIHIFDFESGSQMCLGEGSFSDHEENINVSFCVYLLRKLTKYKN